MIKKINIILVLILILILLYIILRLVYLKKSYVEFELIKCIKNERILINNNNDGFDSEWHWICIDSNDNEFISTKKLKEWGIDFKNLGIDFYKNNVILAFSRKIKQMKFRQKDLFKYRDSYPVMTIMSSEFEPNTIYIYIIPKYYIVEDTKARINME